MNQKDNIGSLETITMLNEQLLRVRSVMSDSLGAHGL